MSTEEKAVVEYRAKDGTQIKLSPQIIRSYLVSGKSELVTDQELFIYMGLCKSRGLNPFIKDCYITKFSQNDPAAIITSIDYYRKRARAQKDCKGWTYGIIILGDNGKPVYRNGCLLLDDEKLIGGWAEATPEGWTVPMRKEVNLKRYIKKKQDGTVTRFWSTDNQPEQIAKVAESQMLRAAWPDEFQGLYVDSEIQSRDAQEDLNAAVSTATPSDPGAPSFDEVFAAELDDPMFSAYLKTAGETYKLSAEEVRTEFVKQEAQVPDQIKRLFAEWKKRPAAPTAGSVGQAAGSQPSGEPPKETTFRDEWINLKGPGYSTCVFKNLSKFKELEGELHTVAVAKWQKLYPEAPCPFATPVAPENFKETTQDPRDDEIINTMHPDSDDPEKVELDRLRAEIHQHDKVHGGHAKQARYELQMSLTSTPMNIDGCRVLLERIEAMLRERPPGGNK